MATETDDKTIQQKTRYKNKGAKKRKKGFKNV